MANKYDFSKYDEMMGGRLPGGYCEITATDERGNTARIITNRVGEGLFIRMKDGTYHQVKGTLQYRLPGSKSAIRRQLAKMLEDDEV